MQKLLRFFSKNIGVYAIFNGQSFNDKLTNDIVSFEQLGRDCNGTKVGVSHVHMSEGTIFTLTFRQTSLREHCRPSSDAAEHGISSVYTVYHY